jgi:hypothetical protein
MRIAVIGSRTITDYDLVEKTILEHLKISEISLVVSGGAKGADTLGELFAKKHNLETKILYPDWKKFGRSAGFIRNKDIINECDIVFAFWNGASRGTKNSLDIAERMHKKIILKKVADEIPA